MDPALQLADFFLLFFFALAQGVGSVVDALNFIARQVSAEQLATYIAALDEVAAGRGDPALLDEVIRRAASLSGYLVEGDFRSVAAEFRDILARTRGQEL